MNVPDWTFYPKIVLGINDMILKDNYEESKVQSGALLAARYINLMLQSAQKT
jgi:hypothetical protein